MAIILEDGSGIENANAYIDASYFDEYCSLMGYSSHDSSLATTEKEGCILRGMVLIDAYEYDGYKTHTINDLSHPRGNMYFKGKLVDAYTVHGNVKKALAEAAYREEISSGILLPDSDTGQIIKRDKTDILETEYFEGTSNKNPFPVIKILLKDFIDDSTTIELQRSIG